MFQPVLLPSTIRFIFLSAACLSARFTRPPPQHFLPNSQFRNSFARSPTSVKHSPKEVHHPLSTPGHHMDHQTTRSRCGYVTLSSLHCPGNTIVLRAELGRRGLPMRREMKEIFVRASHRRQMEWEHKKVTHMVPSTERQNSEKAQD
jgi:hypothetical protein